MTPDWFDRITVAIGVIMLNVMLVVGVLQVLSRYIDFPIALYWTYEVARTFLTLMTIVSIPYLFKNESDISFLPVLKRLTNRTDQMLLLRNLLVGFLAAVLVVSAYQAWVVAGDQSLPMIGWFKIGWGYLFVGLSASVLLLVILVDTRDRIDEFRGETNV